MTNSTLSNGEKLLPAPGGWRPRTLIRHVPDGFVIHVDDTGDTYAVSPAGATLRWPAPSAEAKAWAAKQAAKPRPGPSVGDGWQCFTEQTFSAALGVFTAHWDVPSAPTSHNGQVVYYFPCTADSFSGPTLLQPVLQYGVSPAGGGNYWGIASWYMIDYVLHHSTLDHPISVGTRLYGSITLDSGTWTVKFAGYQIHQITVSNYATQYWAANALEAYGLTTETDLPPSTVTIQNDGLKDTSGEYVGNTNLTVHNWASGCTAVLNSNDNPGGSTTLKTPTS